MDDLHLARCQEIIGYQFSDPALLRQALIHASASATRIDSNERMEFLGDAVLGMVICQEVYRRCPRLLEGEMTKIKSSVVSRRTCAWVAGEMGLIDLMQLGKGVESLSQLPPSLSAAAFEAVVGAVFLDGGVDKAREFILESMQEPLAEAIGSDHQRNYKSMLQQYSQREWNMTPEYRVLDEKGPEHAKAFEVAVRLNGQEFPSAWGNSKKQAEQRAALAAVKALGLVKDKPLPPSPPQESP